MWAQLRTAGEPALPGSVVESSGRKVACCNCPSSPCWRRPLRRCQQVPHSPVAAGTSPSSTAIGPFVRRQARRPSPVPPGTRHHRRIPRYRPRRRRTTATWDRDRRGAPHAGATGDRTSPDCNAASPSADSRPAEPDPANLIVFDVLQDLGADVRGLPFRARRARLERLAGSMVPPLQVTPGTSDIELARQWLEDYGRADVGIEGLVAKGMTSRYQPGVRGWVKHKILDTVDVVVGAVIGTCENAERLVLGRSDDDGTLRIVGSHGVAQAQPARRAPRASLHRSRTPLAFRDPCGSHRPLGPWPATDPSCGADTRW